MTAPSHSRNVNGVRYYTDPTTGRTDLISVTSALDNVGSPDALIGWAIRLTADQAFDIDYANADALKRATHVEKNRAADRGTRVHETLEETVKVGHRPNHHRRFAHNDSRAPHNGARLLVTVRTEPGESHR